MAACGGTVGLDRCTQIGWTCPRHASNTRLLAACSLAHHQQWWQLGPGGTPACRGCAPAKQRWSGAWGESPSTQFELLFFHSCFWEGWKPSGISLAGCSSRCCGQGRTGWGCSGSCRAPSPRAGRGEVREAWAVLTAGLPAWHRWARDAPMSMVQPTQPRGGHAGWCQPRQAGPGGHQALSWWGSGVPAQPGEASVWGMTPRFPPPSPLQPGLTPACAPEGFFP